MKKIGYLLGAMLLVVSTLFAAQQKDNVEFTIVNQSSYSIKLMESGFLSSNSNMAKSFIIIAPKQLLAPGEEIKGYRIFQMNSFKNLSVQFNLSIGYGKKGSGKTSYSSSGQQVELFLTNIGFARGYVVKTGQYSAAVPISVSFSGSNSVENSVKGKGKFVITITNSESTVK